MTPLPPTFTEETKREFEKLWGGWNGAPEGTTKGLDWFIESFLLSRTQAAYELGRAETLKEVRGMCEGMIGRQVCRNPACGKESHHCENTIRNDAFRDLITRLTQ